MRSTQVWNIYLSYHLRGKTASWPLRLVVLPSKGKSQFTWDSILLLLSFSSTKLVFSISEGTAINLSKASKLLSVCSRFLRVDPISMMKEWTIYVSLSPTFTCSQFKEDLNILQSKKPCPLPSIADSYSVYLLNFPPLFDLQVPIMNSSYKKNMQPGRIIKLSSHRPQGFKVVKFSSFLQINCLILALSRMRVCCKSLQTYCLQRCQLLIACGRFLALRQAKTRVRAGQGCISCGILVSGIGARGVSSEHMENMEMFSCSPT